MKTLASIKFNSTATCDFARNELEKVLEAASRRFCIVLCFENDGRAVNLNAPNFDSWSDEEQVKVQAWIDGFMASRSLWER